MQFTRMRDANITMSQAMLSQSEASAAGAPVPRALSNSRNSRSHRARG